MKKPPVRELSIERYFNREVRKLNGDPRKLKFPGRRSAADRLTFFHHGVLYFVELKRPGKKASTAQGRDHERLRKRGFTVHVLATKDQIDNFITIVKIDLKHAAEPDFDLLS